MPRWLSACRSHGWTTIAATADSRVRGGDLTPAQRDRCVLVMGNEGFGLRTNVLRECSALMGVPLTEDAVEVRLGGWGVGAPLPLLFLLRPPPLLCQGR